jgi:hypothetical protein
MYILYLYVYEYTVFCYKSILYNMVSILSPIYTFHFQHMWGTSTSSHVLYSLLFLVCTLFGQHLDMKMYYLVGQTVYYVINMKHT